MDPMESCVRNLHLGLRLDYGLVDLIVSIECRAATTAALLK